MAAWRRELKKFQQPRLERISTVEQVPRFVALAQQVSAQSWQTRQFGLRVSNDEATRRALAALAANGLLRSYLWFDGDLPIAFAVGNQDRRCYHYEEVGYDTSFARLSPGRLMLWQILEDLLNEHPPEWFDFGGGDADYKQLFATHESRSGSLWLLPPTTNSRVTLSLLQAGQAVRQTARQIVRQVGLASRMRQWFRRSK
jgi:CelD/BcsL family acetyltransferase involved in cellulose biosynthesis